MNFKQLRAFREVMQTQSISEAARRLNRTQPAISSLISGLENQLNIKLFERRGMRLHPVPEAYYLLEEAKNILDNLENTRQTMQSIRNLEQGKLNLVCMPGPSIFFIPDLIDKFLSENSKVNVSLITKGSNTIESLISAQQYDLGLADIERSKELSNKSKLVNYKFFNVPCLCALHHDDPLCKKKRITAMDLNKKPLALLHSEHSTRLQTEQAFKKTKSTLNVYFEAQYFIPLLTFVEKGRATAIVDALTVKSYNLFRQQDAKIVFRPFDPSIFLSAVILTPTKHPISQLTEQFISLISAEIERCCELKFEI